MEGGAEFVEEDAAAGARGGAVLVEQEPLHRRVQRDKQACGGGSGAENSGVRVIPAALHSVSIIVQISPFVINTGHRRF